MPHLTSNIHLEIAPGLFCALDVAVRCEIVFTDKRGEGCRLENVEIAVDRIVMKPFAGRVCERAEDAGWHPIDEKRWPDLYEQALNALMDAPIGDAWREYREDYAEGYGDWMYEKMRDERDERDAEGRP
jgi:hypothetical protein